MRYLVIHKRPDQKVERVSILDFVGEEGDDLIFSARPKAGTQRIRKKDVLYGMRLNEDLLRGGAPPIIINAREVPE